MRKRMQFIRAAFNNLMTLLLVAAIIQELRKPREQRSWHGTVAGFVPYDFRIPTPGKIVAAFWSPDSPNIFNPHVFGVGWTLNIGRLVRLIQTALAR